MLVPHKDPTEAKAYWAAYYQANRVKHDAQSRAWGKAHPEYGVIKSTRWLSNHPEYRETKNSHISAWRKRNPDKVRSYGASRRARKKNAFVEFVDFSVVFDRDGGICQICHKPIGDSKWHIDHRIPLIRGGKHSYENTQLSHATCNLVKGANTSSRFVGHSRSE